MKIFKDYVEEISKESLIEYYITKNHSQKECHEHFNIKSTMFSRLLNYYNIHKPKELHTVQIKKSKKEHFGDENYNNSSKRTKTNLEKYGVENQFQRKELFPKIQEKKFEKYGNYNNIQKNLETRTEHYGSIEESYKQQQETYRQTCLEKYGVTNSAKLKETREKIAEQLKETFTEKYGCNCYWTKDDAKRSNGSKNSKANLEFKTLLEQNNIKYKQEVLYDNKWFDFEVDNYLIEINPTPTHNSTWSPYSNKGIDIDYHQNKTIIAKNNNKNCIHVFDWDNIDKILNILRSTKNKIYARNCEIREVAAKEAVDFLEMYHLQGYARDAIRLGLYYNNELVSLMTFGKPRYNKKFDYELIRYCNSNCIIIGGAEKLFNYFLEKYRPQSIISYCDMSKFNGNVYEKLGFTAMRKARPSKHWYNIQTKEHITDNLLRQQGFDRLFKTNYGKGTSNEELMLKSGFVEVYDCGQQAFSYRLS